MNDLEPQYATESEACSSCGRWFSDKREAHETRENEAARHEERGFRILQEQQEHARGV
jgi:hypothetical protein